LALGADPLEEHDELELEEDHGIDAGPAAVGVEVARPVADEAKIQLGFKMAVEMVPWDEIFE
jgi:hypothetical protein